MSSTLIVPREVAAKALDRACATCRFKHKDRDGDLVCRNRPPTAFLSVEPMPAPHIGKMGFKVRAAFPVVLPDQWCGAWEGRGDG